MFIQNYLILIHRDNNVITTDGPRRYHSNCKINIRFITGVVKDNCGNNNKQEKIACTLSTRFTKSIAKYRH